ncbi:hypothetical protein [Burkholderia oklahomensis]|uniref:hypothetical protein n=1 Tax=Burkholderia oklahomensis TaxID=342113 RepID=UPI0012F4D99A|nr:hypothetical protein [Burkholderia oklahomensis]
MDSLRVRVGIASSLRQHWPRNEAMRGERLRSATVKRQTANSKQQTANSKGTMHRASPLHP